MIDCMIITYNESLNLPHCLAALKGWTNKVFVVDSGSTDGTPELARGGGAVVVHQQWLGYARQKNWGLDNLPLEAPWTLILDADEIITPEVRERLVAIASQPVDSVPENGFFLNRLTYFLGKPIRHCGYFPSWNLRFFKRGRARYEDRVVHEHMIINDPVGYIREPMLHDDRRGLEHYIAKHNRYSTLEAEALYAEIQGRVATPAAKLRRDTSRRRWLKRYVLPHAPMPWVWRFFYMYVIKLGVLDGRTGLEFCKFISMYDYLVAMKLRSLRRLSRVDSQYLLEAGMTDQPPTDRGSAPAAPVAPRAVAPPPSPPTPTATEVEPPAKPAAGPPTAPTATGDIAPAERPAVPDEFKISIMILTLNEETNIEACLDSVREFKDVVVFDSYSTDRTVELARARGARIVQRSFDNWSAHQNWAMEHIEFRHEWVFYLDADERMTDELREELRAIAERKDEPRVAFYAGRRNYFMGRWIKRSMPPGMIMRFFRPPCIRFERLVNPTPVLSGEHGYLKNHFDHYNFSKGITEWIDKHNKYSRMEAMEGLKLLRGELGEQPSLFSRDPALRRKAMKNLSFRLPFRPAVKFAYMYFVRLGILDGLPGLTYCMLNAIYEYMIVVKMRELRRREKGLPI